MRGGSPAAETGHAWAAAAHISPLCKVAGPPMINSTGEQNGGSERTSRSRFVITASRKSAVSLAERTRPGFRLPRRTGRPSA